MAKGAIAKAEFTNWLMEHYDGVFMGSDGKTIRVPMIENGEQVELKIALTCAKDLEGGGSGFTNALAGSGNPQAASAFDSFEAPKEIHVTEEEKENIANLMERLGL